jgi:hypothetical protein
MRICDDMYCSCKLVLFLDHNSSKTYSYWIWEIRSNIAIDSSGSVYVGDGLKIAFS